MSTPERGPETAPYTAHLLVVCHGLWGTRSHIAYICKSALEHTSNATSPKSRPRSGSIGTQDEDVRLVVLPASLNENTLTYDGIDLCAERVVEEIDLEVKRIAEDGGTVKRFSIVGYSLGGLVARYALGLLESRTPSFFAEVRPVNFTTFASPAIGIPKYDGFWSDALAWLGSRMLSRSGSQLYGTDRFLPSSLIDGNNQPEKPNGTLSRLSFKKEKAEPLLAVMADPQYSFFRALVAFERVEIYANSVNDRTVPYPTGAIEAHDPFSLARARAKKAAAARGDDPDVEPDIALGGLEIKLDSTGLLIESYRKIDPPPALEKSTATPRRRFKLSLPLLLRPTTYPFSRPLSLLIIVLLPVALPLSIIFLIGRFLIAGHSSQRRIRQLRVGLGGGRTGMLERVGVRLREVAETVQPDNPEHAGSLGNGGLGEDEGGSPGKEEREPVRRHPSFAAFANYGGTETPPLARAVSPNPEDFDPEVTGEEGTPFQTDPILSPAQVTMIKNLNSIPQLRKHLAYMPLVRNSHGSIVARDLSYAAHRDGTKVVDAWAKEFVL
ncbi:hypothetical protein RQP46_004697 [Phenoliferia psychrophenolica]